MGWEGGREEGARGKRERGRREEGGEQEIKSVSFEHKASGHMESWYIISLSPGSFPAPSLCCIL